MNQLRGSRAKIGEILLRQGVINEDQLEHALEEHKRTGILLGKILVRLGMVDQETLDSVVGAQITLKTKQKIGDILVSRGYITQQQLDSALEKQRETKQRLGRTLVEMGVLTEDRLIEILSAQLEVQSIRLDTFKFDNADAVMLLPEDLCRSYKVIPLYQQDKTLTVAMSDPSNLRILDHIRFKTQMQVDPVIATEKEILAALDKVYGAADHGESLDQLIAEDGELEKVEEKAEDDEVELTDEESRQVVKIVSTIVNEAIARRASDIHLEPQETYLKLRYRIDGDLVVQKPIPARLMGKILSRIKILANMNIAEKRKPLDGRFTVRHKGKEVDLRVNSFPVTMRKRGVVEKIVMRILDPNSGQIALKDMGFGEEVLKQFLASINLPNGIVLVTGPTGSGKSTTLYACIREINDPTVNVTTMEDPVEMNLDGVNQGQINNAAGFTFAAGIRAILRQDPDIIMIGEMRDKETASMAIESALTGHLVFSTLHTNDSSGAFPRLLEMGLEPFLVASALKGVLAQRLVRRICSKCKAPVEISKEIRDTLGLSREAVFYQGKGCSACDGCGYRGRMGIYEYLVPNEAIRAMVLRHASSDEIKREAMKCGMQTLRMDGMDKALRGLTTLEQVLGSSEADE